MPSYNESVQINGSADTTQLTVKANTAGAQNQPLQAWQNAGGTVLAKVDKDGNTQVPKLEVSGGANAEKLIVKGVASQSVPLQQWQNSSSAVLGQVTHDGRVQFGDDLGVATPDAMIEAHRAHTATSKPATGFHSLGRIAGSLVDGVIWSIHELEIWAGGTISGIHQALRARITNRNTGAGAGARFEAGNFTAINEVATGTSGAQAVGLSASVINTSGASMSEAVGIEVDINNSGTLSKAYAIKSKRGLVRTEEALEFSAPSTVPGAPALGTEVRVYAKSDGRLYARNTTAEYDLLASGGIAAVQKNGVNVVIIIALVHAHALRFLLRRHGTGDNDAL